MQAFSIRANRLLWLKIVVALLIFSGFLYVTDHRVDPDFLWHLKVGNWILDHHAVPHTDIYSYSMAGYSWTDHEWLVDSFIAFMNNKGLGFVVILFFTFLSFTPFLIWLRRMQSTESLWLVLLAGLFSLPLIGVRPQMISFALFFLLFELLRETYGGEIKKFRTLPFFIGVIFLFFIWANVHAGFFSGLFLLGLFIVLHHYEDFLKNSTVQRKQLRRDASLFGISILATLANPYAYHLYGEVLQTIFSHQTQQHVIEWRSGLSFPFMGFILFLSVFVSAVLLFRKKFRASALMPAIVFCLFYIKSVRHAPFFLIAAFPVVERGLDFARKDISLANSTHPHTPFVLKTLKMFATAGFIAIISLFFYQAFLINNTPDFPEGAVTFLNQSVSSQNIVLLNEYDWGGYLIYNAPTIKDFIDGRMPHWVDENGSSAMRDYVRVFYSSESGAVRDVVSKYGINTALLRTPKGERSQPKGFVEHYMFNLVSQGSSTSPFLRQVANFFFSENRDVKLELLNMGWKVVYEDKTATVLNCNCESLPRTP